ncbi:hypothetical protein BYT27DRAFT_7308965 [Phlegmacium glaucopus]|nr:hypothetical protein BYT27DRAFT_7308965 [Phlegmacium glaucopus]
MVPVNRPGRGQLAALPLLALALILGKCALLAIILSESGSHALNGTTSSPRITEGVESSLTKQRDVGQCYNGYCWQWCLNDPNLKFWCYMTMGSSMDGGYINYRFHEKKNLNNTQHLRIIALAIQVVPIPSSVPPNYINLGLGAAILNVYIYYTIEVEEEFQSEKNLVGKSAYDPPGRSQSLGCEEHHDEWSAEKEEDQESLHGAKRNRKYGSVILVESKLRRRKARVKVRQYPKRNKEAGHHKIRRKN